MIHNALPKKLQKKIGRRTVIRRVNAKKFFYQEKRSKDDPSEALKQRRIRFCRFHQDKNFQQWQSHLQAVADLSDPLCGKAPFFSFDLVMGPLSRIFWVGSCKYKCPDLSWTTTFATSPLPKP
jgi:hypothetical protein